jgi:hypothetical protein
LKTALHDASRNGCELRRTCDSSLPAGGKKTKTNGMFAQLLFGVPRISPFNNGGRRCFNHDGEHIAESQVELAQIVATMQVGLRHHFFDRKSLRGRETSRWP